MNLQKECISYILEDIKTQRAERFDLFMNTIGGFVFDEASNLFTGIEWWNRIGNYPYPIRYKVEVSQLACGFSDKSSDPEDITYYPINALIPNSEGSNVVYPVTFYNPRIESGCICYDVKSGNCKSGMEYLPPRIK
jgi:hypothetical protein